MRSFTVFLYFCLRYFWFRDVACCERVFCSAAATASVRLCKTFFFEPHWPYVRCFFFFISLSRFTCRPFEGREVGERFDCYSRFFSRDCRIDMGYVCVYVLPHFFRL